MSALTITGKAIGSKKPLFADWSVPFPPQWQGDDAVTLRQLIDHVVRSEVQAFRERDEQRRLLQALSAAQIAAGVAKGKVEMGHPELPQQTVDEDQAVAVACQAFEDGLFLAVIDGQSLRDLDQQVYLQPDSTVAFVRLTLLAGG